MELSCFACLELETHPRKLWSLPFSPQDFPRMRCCQDGALLPPWSRVHSVLARSDPVFLMPGIWSWDGGINI